MIAPTSHSTPRLRLTALLLVVVALALFAVPAPEKTAGLESAAEVEQQVSVPGLIQETEVKEQSLILRTNRRLPNYRRTSPPRRRPSVPGIPEPKPDKAEPQPRKSPSYPKAKPRAQRPKEDPSATVALAAKGGASVQQGPPSNSQDPIEVGADLSWKSLPASGSPMNGHLMIEVGPAKKQPRKSKPRNLVLLLDVSGSMGLPLERIANPVLFLMERLAPGDRGVVVAFSNRASVLRSDASMAEYRRKLDPLMRARSTDLLVGLRAAIGELQNGKGDGRVDQLVVLTDGLTGDGNRSHEKQCAAVVEQAAVPMVVLGYGSECNRALLRTLAHRSGGDFTFVYDVAQLLETVMGDVLGLSGVVTRNNRLVVTLKEGVKVSQAFLLGPQGRQIKVKVQNGSLEIPLGELREGERIQIVLEVVLPSGESGTQQLARARVRYDKPDGKGSVSAPAEVKLEYTDSWARPQRNQRMKDVVSEIQKVSRKF